MAQGFRLTFPLWGAIFLGLLALPPRDASASPPPGAPRYGIWVEVEADEGRPRPFRSKEELTELLRILAENPFTDIYCQVYRGGRSWFPSVLADDAPFTEAQQFGADPLRMIIDLAHAKGARVHAWLNVLRIDRNLEAPILRRLGPGIVLVDSRGHSLLDVNERTHRPWLEELDTPGIWIDPSVLSVRHYLAAITKEVLKNYPDLDGIHLDMVRFPFTGSGTNGPMTFPYGAEAQRRFRAETGKVPPRPGQQFAPSAPIAPVATVPEWDEWRRKQVTELVKEIRAGAIATQPDVELSAAVLAWPDRAQNHAFQDWPSWIDRGVLDTAVIMNYTSTPEVFRTNLNHAVRGLKEGTVQHGQGRILAGVGAWLFLRSPHRLLQQIEIAKMPGSDGYVLFSYANLTSSNGLALLDAMRRVREPLRGSPRRDFAD